MRLDKQLPAADAMPDQARALHRENGRGKAWRLNQSPDGTRDCTPPYNPTMAIISIRSRGPSRSTKSQDKKDHHPLCRPRRQESYYNWTVQPVTGPTRNGGPAECPPPPGRQGGLGCGVKTSQKKTTLIDKHEPVSRRCPGPLDPTFLLLQCIRCLPADSSLLLNRTASLLRARSTSFRQITDRTGRYRQTRRGCVRCRARLQYKRPAKLPGLPTTAFVPKRKGKKNPRQKDHGKLQVLGTPYSVQYNGLPLPSNRVACS